MQNDPMFFVKIKQRMIHQYKQNKDIIIFNYNDLKFNIIDYVNNINVTRDVVVSNIFAFLSKYGNFWISDPGTGAEECWIYDNLNLAKMITTDIIFCNNTNITLCLVKVDPDTDKYFYNRVHVLQNIYKNTKEKVKDIL